MSRTKERISEGFEDEPQDAVAGASDDEVDETDGESSEGEQGATELTTVPFVGGDGYDAF